MAFLTGSGWLGREEAQKSGYNSCKGFFGKVFDAVTFKWARTKK